jgi:hypothetical protein
VDRVQEHLDVIEDAMKTVPDTKRKRNNRNKLTKTVRKTTELRQDVVRFEELASQACQETRVVKKTREVLRLGKYIKRGAEEIHRGFRRYMGSIISLFPLWENTLVDEHQSLHRKSRLEACFTQLTSRYTRDGGHQRHHGATQT